MGGLLDLVQRGEAWRGPSLPRPLLAVPNVTAHPSMTSVPTTVQLQFFLTQIFLHLNVFCWQKKTNYAKLIKLCAAAKLCTKLCACIIPPYSCNCVRSKSLQAVVFSGVVMLVCFPKLSLWIFQNNLAVFLMPLNFGLKSRFLDHRSRRAPVTPSSECECR